VPRLYAPLRLPRLTQSQVDNLDLNQFQDGDLIENITIHRVIKLQGTTWTALSEFDFETVPIASSLSGFISGGIDVNALVMAHIFDVETTFPVDAPGSVVKPFNPPIGSNLTLEIVKIHPDTLVETVIGTITFTADSTSNATVSIPTEKVFLVNDIIGLKSPNDTLGISNIFVNILGHSLVPVYA